MWKCSGHFQQLESTVWSLIVKLRSWRFVSSSSWYGREWRQYELAGGGRDGGAVREPHRGLPAHLGQLRVLVRGGALLQPRTLRWLDCLHIDCILKMKSWWQLNDKVLYIIKSSPSCSLRINQKRLRIKGWKNVLLKNWQMNEKSFNIDDVYQYYYIFSCQGLCPTLPPLWPWCPRIWGNRHLTSCWRYSPPLTFCE